MTSLVSLLGERRQDIDTGQHNDGCVQVRQQQDGAGQIHGEEGHQEANDTGHADQTLDRQTFGDHLATLVQRGFFETDDVIGPLLSVRIHTLHEGFLD